MLLCRYIDVTSTLLASGGIDFKYKITPFDPDQYDFKYNPTDIVRSCLEGVFLLMLCRLLVIEVVELVDRFQNGRAAGKSVFGSIMNYFGDFGNVLDLSNYVIQGLAAREWLLIVNSCYQFEETFGFRYDVYDDFFATGRYAKMNGPSAAAVMDIYSNARRITVLFQDYINLVAVSLVLLMAQTLKNLDFHPRMGLITQTLKYASADLFFFMLLFTIVHTIYAFLGCLIMGNYSENYANLGKAWLIGLHMLMVRCVITCTPDPTSAKFECPRALPLPFAPGRTV